MLTIEFFSLTYSRFYTELINRAAKMVDKRKLVYTPKEDFNFWKLPPKDGGKTTIAIEIFNKNYAPTYWRDHKSDHNVEEKDWGEDASLPEQVRVITPSLKLIGCKIPKNLKSYLDNDKKWRLVFYINDF